jgi:hypothetical protein
VSLSVPPLQYSRANSREEKNGLFFVIFDYAVHQINEACLTCGISTYNYDDAPLASLLAFADAYICEAWR